LPVPVAVMVRRRGCRWGAREKELSRWECLSDQEGDALALQVLAILTVKFVVRR